MKNTMACLAAALCLACGTASAGPNLVTNGSFEDGTNGWIMEGGMGVGVYFGGLVHSGERAATTGCVGEDCVSTAGEGSYFAQSIATTAGSTYEMSFWIAENGGPTSEVSVFWNGIKVADLLNPNNDSYLNGTGPIQFTIGGLLATGDATLFEVHGRQDVANIFFDDVSVTETAAADVPEPGTLAVLLTGLGLLGATRRGKPGLRRRR